MSSRNGSLISLFITALGDATGFFEWPLEYSEGWRRKQLRGASRKDCSNALYRMKARGLVKVVSKEGKKFLALTAKGELEKLFVKAATNVAKAWDGKWRMLIFDIPEGASQKRDQFRWLLKHNGYIKLQASVYISPYPINREAVDYLQEIGLIPYVRMARVDELDNDIDLRKKFGLPKKR